MGTQSACLLALGLLLWSHFVSFASLVLAVQSPSLCLQCRWWDLESSCRQGIICCSFADLFFPLVFMLLYVPVGLAGHLFLRSFEPGVVVGPGAALNLRAT